MKEAMAKDDLHDVSKMKGRYFGCENKKKWNHHRLVIQCSQAIMFKDVQPMSLSVVSKAHSPVESHQAEAEVEDP